MRETSEPNSHEFGYEIAKPIGRNELSRKHR